MSVHSLPIDAILPNIQALLQQHSTLIVQAAPGAGKTTRVPLALLNQTWLQQQKIVMLEPRRLAAKTAALYMAKQLGESVGETVGYKMRFESAVSARTRIEVITEGILTRQLQQDTDLSGIGVVIFDEFHERSLNAETALAFCLEIQQVLREDLKIILMSATLDATQLASQLNAPIITSEGRAFPVTVHYQPVEFNQSIAEQMSNNLQRIVTQTTGDILAFLPGSGEIRQVQQRLEPHLPTNIRLFPLYGDLSRENQEHAIQPAPAGLRKIVLTTPIAETSLTIEGITTVVDSGWRRSPKFDPRTGMTRLELQRISKASAEQRAGRAGRLQAGQCFRLWTTTQQDSLAAQTPPEIVEADLTGLVLDLAQWGTVVEQLTWITPPPPAALAQAREVLQMLGALDNAGYLTDLGKAMNQWAMSPRLARMMCAAVDKNWGALACDIAALLSERDVLRDGRNADFMARLEMLRCFRQQGKAIAQQRGADIGSCFQVNQAAQQWRSQLPNSAKNTAQVIDEETVAILLAFAYPDRVAQRRAGSHERYRLANGRGAILAAGNHSSEFIVVASLDAGHTEAKIFLAAHLSKNMILQELADILVKKQQISWDTQQDCVLAQQTLCLGELVLQSQPLNKVDEKMRLQALLQGIRQAGLNALPWTDKAREWQARLLALRHWLPEQAWQEVSDEWLLANLEQWLAPYLTNVNRLSHLNQLNLYDILQNLLTWEQQKQLEQLAPTHLTVPSGSQIRLQYQPDQPPILAVRLQELFGWQQTPTIAQGKIKVMLHLLSPAHRPIQVTQDLQNFWENTYAEVKKELKGRYPKHYWPDNPYEAIATRRARPQS